ncbi:hypothetical protein Tcan_01583 [Toxocara canis]|uniref:Uncharacterized protein n=1 Tax=Toxocara canis TaxID=6265 RepID=A0A0B2VVB9_TOXCA|nr:hypothetical protein Tcan_01583 [Toxocara canis]
MTSSLIRKRKRWRIVSTRWTAPEMYGGHWPGDGSAFCGFQFCPQDTPFSYYTCCNGLLAECCYYLRSWVIVVIVLGVLFGLLCICACVGALIYMAKKRSSPSASINYPQTRSFSSQHGV